MQTTETSTTSNATAQATAGRLFGYGRVSTKDQTTENQRRELEAAGWQIQPRRWLADEGVSGKVPAMQRPQLRVLLDRLEAGDTLVVAKLDRLGRDMIDVEQTLDHLESMDVSVVVQQLGKTDLTSSGGKMVRRVLAAVAAMERDLLIERTQAGLARAKAEGKTLGRPRQTDDAKRAELRELVNSGGATVTEAAKRYGISRAAVYKIVQEAA